MAKFSSKIGFVIRQETTPGVWMDSISERTYYGDILKKRTRWESSQNLNDDLRISNQFSIIADDFAYENLGYMRYIEWLGSKWTISNIEIEYPRLTIDIGGLYNG